MAKQKRKSAPIATHAVVCGKKFLLAKTWDETKNVMSLIDDQVEIVEPKLRTGVVDIPSALFREFAWTRHQMPKAIAALDASGAKEVTLEFLPAEAKAPAARRAKPKGAEPKSPLEAPAEAA